MRGSALPRSAVAGPTSRCKGNTRARKYETEMLILIGEKVLKRSVSDGQALTGCRVREGVAARHLLVRPSLRSRSGDPDLEAGGPKRIERQGASDTGNRIGKALTGRPSGLPVCRRPVTSAGSFCTPKGDRAPRLGFCPSHRGVGSFHRAAAIGQRDVGRWDTHPGRSDDPKHGHEHAECGSCVCCHGISYVP